MSIEIRGDADWYMHRIQFKYRAVIHMNIQQLDEANHNVETKGYHEFRGITFTRKDMSELLTAMHNNKLIQPKKRIKYNG